MTYFLVFTMRFSNFERISWVDNTPFSFGAWYFVLSISSARASRKTRTRFAGRTDLLFYVLNFLLLVLQLIVSASTDAASADAASADAASIYKIILTTY